MTAQPMTVATKLRFSERMKGFVALDEADPVAGWAQGHQLRQGLVCRLTITIDDIDAFTADPQHEAGVGGHVHCDVLGGRLRVAAGWFNLFTHDTDPKQRWMRYRLHLTDPGDNPLTLVGVKDVHNNGIFKLWRDTSTLYTRILSGHIAPGEDDVARSAAAGVIAIRPSDFAKQLSTFRVEAPCQAARTRAVMVFGRLFLRELWAVYGRAPGRGADAQAASSARALIPRARLARTHARPSRLGLSRGFVADRKVDSPGRGPEGIGARTHRPH